MKKNLFFLLLSFIMFGSSSALALDKEGDYYLIGNAQDMVDFAALVNNGTAEGSGSKAKLTADIDLSSISNWTPMGTDGSRFWGEFDGQGHRIKNLTITGTKKEQGFFGVASSATIKNLIFDSSCNINSGPCTAALIGCCNGSGDLNIENVGIECDVVGTNQNCAAFVGCNYGGIAIKIRNCYNTGNITGGRESAVFSGWFGNNGNAIVENCWSTGTVIGQDGSNSFGRGIGSSQFVHSYDLSNNSKIDATKWNGYDSSWMSTGEWAYKLNEAIGSTVWYQLIDTDAHPTPFASEGNTVYAVGSQYCDGDNKPDASYSNTQGEASRDDHNFNKWGFCTNSHDGKTCDQIQLDFLTAVDGYYEIANEKQLNWFAEYVKRVSNAINGKLTADIDFTSVGNEMIGPEDGNPFKGIFDGQGHKVTVQYDANQKNSALFRYIQDATIKNLIVDGTISNTNSCSAGIFAGSRGASVVENCVSYVTYNRTDGGDATFGGIGAYMHDNGTIRNCAFLGEINAPNANGCGGILGYANGGDRVKIERCLLNATISLSNGGGDPFVRNTNPTASYFVERGNLNSHDQGTQVTTAQLTSGEIAFLLNGSVSGGTPWHQLIGTDDNPLPIAKDGAVVYTQGSLNCDGSAKDDVTYVNTETEPVQDAHQFADGFCSKCETYDPTYMTETDGYYEVENGKQLRWTAAYSQDNPAIKVKLMNDIDMEGIKFGGFAKDADDKRFTGEIDGQFNVVKNLTFTADYANAGFVNAATVGATIKNLTLDASCSFTGTGALGAFIGGVRGSSGDLFITNCGNEASVTTTGANGAGFIGCKYDDNVIPNLTNCYQIGVIKSGKDGGSFSGWMPKAKYVNCYSKVSPDDGYGFEQGQQFGRGWSQELTNCYDYGTGDWGTNNGSWGSAFAGNRKLTEEFIASGELVEALADNVWHQALGEGSHPVLHKNYDLDETFAHHKFYAHADANISMTRTTVANTWNTICLPFALDADEVKAVFGSDAQVAEFDSYDAAADNYSFKSVTEMEAGKAYLVKSSTALSAPVVLTGKALVTEAVANDFFKGDFNPQAVAVGDKIVAANNIAMNVNKADRIKGFRAFFPSQGGEAKDGTFTVDGESTGIIAIENGELNAIDFNGAVYDLQGRKVSTPKHGVYVVNGKKVVIK